MAERVPEIELGSNLAIRVRGTDDLLLSNFVAGHFSRGHMVRFKTQDEAEAKMAKLVATADRFNATFPTDPPRPTALEVVRVRTLISAI